MLLLAAAVALSAPPAETPSSTVVTAQARASVRIISAVTLRLGEGALSGDAPPARDTIVHPGGIAQAANLIEFE
jgi:hypothetical protein